MSGFNAPKLALCYFESGIESRLMRVWGWVLLIGGFLLCASIVWAAIGFLLMGLGLIFLQIAARKRKRLAKLAASRPEKSDVRREPPLQELFQALTRSDKDELEPIGRKRTVVSYDEERWHLLLRNDADIARLATVLAPYGEKYVDELAAAYLVLNDKEYLPMILQKIIASARKDSGQNVAGDLHETPNADVVGRALASTPRADSARVHDPISANEAPPKEGTPKEAAPKTVRVVAFARNLGGGATATDETDPKPAAIAAQSAGDLNGGRQNAAEAINAKPPEVPAAAAGRDLERDAREADAVDADNLNGILDRLTRVLTAKND